MSRGASSPGTTDAADVYGGAAYSVGASTGSPVWLKEPEIRPGSQPTKVRALCPLTASYAPGLGL
eukprot:scaffold3475_cov246-Prasinococcus_capsulatus_cf.AAC.4